MKCRKGLLTLLKIFAKYFPLIDHLYIFQLFEYNYWDFLKWFARYPFKRNLQKKHQLNLTGKLMLLGFLSLLFTLIFAIYLWHTLFKGFFVFLIPPAWLILFQFTPLPILLACLAVYPLDLYLKHRIIQKTQDKLKLLNQLKVIAITGSFGKTSTKDILYTLLWKKFRVVKTPKSFNTPLGVAQTVLQDVKQNTDILIAEIGTYKRGEIKNITRLVKPKIGIITAVGPQHLNRFCSLENIAKAKFELVEGLPKNGAAILNGESNLLRNSALHLQGVNVTFYGGENDPFRATGVKTGREGTLFTLITPKGQTDIQIPLIGTHHVQNFLAAVAAAINLGVTLKEIRERAKLLLPTPHRMEVKKLGNLTLIDNSYNTNPKSAAASLDLLNRFDGFKKIVITPGFIELGSQAGLENRKFGKNIASLADEVIIVGRNAREDLLKGLRDSQCPKETIHFAKSTQEALILAQQLASGTNTAALLENDLPDQYF